MATFYNVIQKGVDGKATVDRLYNFLKDGVYFVTFHHLNPQVDIETYRGTYFLKLQLIADETGHSKADMHEIVKEHLVQKLYGKNTTKTLTPEEWLGLLRAMELWAFQTYSIVIP